MEPKEGEAFKEAAPTEPFISRTSVAWSPLLATTPVTGRIGLCIKSDELDEFVELLEALEDNDELDSFFTGLLAICAGEAFAGAFGIEGDEEDEINEAEDERGPILGIFILDDNGFR